MQAKRGFRKNGTEIKMDAGGWVGGGSNKALVYN